MKSKKRTYNLRRIKLDYSYHVHEIAALYGLENSAVLRWVRAGLPTIDKHKPYLIHGHALHAFLRERQTSRRCKLKAAEFYCCKCRAPRTAWENLADIEIRNETKLRIKGLCAACCAPVNRAGAVRKMPEYRKTFTIQTIQGEHITESLSPVVNDHMRKDA